MTVRELVEVVDRKRRSEVKLQVCIDCGGWQNYQELPIRGFYTDCIMDKKIRRVAAVGQNVFRIAIYWKEKQMDYAHEECELPF